MSNDHKVKNVALQQFISSGIPAIPGFLVRRGKTRFPDGCEPDPKPVCVPIT